MNQELEEFARNNILEGLNKLKEDCHMLFKRMYSHKNLGLPIEEIVAKIPEDKLDWAMQQVKNSLKDEKLLK